MRSLLTTILAMFAALFLAVGGNTLIRGPHIAPRSEAAELQNAPPPRTPEDLTVAGALVRNGSLADHRIDGVYYLPLIDPPTADRIEAQGHWSPPTRAPGSRLAIVSLDLEQAHHSGLPWNELETRPGRLGPFVASGAVSTRTAKGPVADLLWERFGLRPDEVWVIDHGNPNFGYPNAAVCAAVGALLGWFALRRRRRRAAPHSAPAPAPGGRALPLLGTLGAALLPLLVFGRRCVDDVARAAGDGASATARHTDLDPAHQRVLEVVDRSKDLADLRQASELLAARRGAAGLTIRRGTEVFGREGDGAWHLVEGNWSLRFLAPDATAISRELSAKPRRELGEDSRIRFVRSDDGSVLAHIEHRDAGSNDVFDVAVRFTVGEFAALEGGNAELVCTGAGLAAIAAAQARMLQRMLTPPNAATAPQVTVAAARTPRFLVRGPLLVVDVGELQFEIAAAAPR